MIWIYSGIIHVQCTMQIKLIKWRKKQLMKRKWFYKWSDKSINGKSQKTHNKNEKEKYTEKLSRNWQEIIIAALIIRSHGFKMWNFVSVCVWLFHLDFHANCTPPTLLSLFSCLVFSISATFTTQCGWLFITFHFFLLLIDMQLIILFWVFFTSFISHT